MIKNIGILGGTFNPPTIAHIWIAQQVLEDEKLDEIWFMPNYTSKNYSKKMSVSSEHRFNMCQCIEKNFYQIYASNIEIVNKFEYTYQLVDHLTSCVYLRDNTYNLIIGGDWNISKFKKWKEITNKINVIKFHRPRINNNYKHQNIRFDLSSTMIRKRISEGKIITGLVIPSVEQYIKETKLYKSWLLSS